MALPAPAESQGHGCFGRFQAQARGQAWPNAYLLALTSYYVYDYAQGARTWAEFKPRCRDLFRQWGMNDGFEFVSAQTLLTDSQAVVMATDRAIIVAFRGSDADPRDKLTSGRFLLHNIGGASVHSGFRDALTCVYTSVKNAVHRLQKQSRRPVWLTGHSLGGAMAILCAYKLQKDGMTVQGVYTYGMPRLGDYRFAAAVDRMFKNRPVQRWVNDHDLVTQLPSPLLGYQHCGQANNIIVNAKGLKVRLNSGEPWMLGMPGYHGPDLYCRRLYYALSKDLRGVMPPPPKRRIP